MSEVIKPVLFRRTSEVLTKKHLENTEKKELLFSHEQVDPNTEQVSYRKQVNLARNY